jgi:hypothetical protein
MFSGPLFFWCCVMLWVRSAFDEDADESYWVLTVTATADDVEPM